MYQPPAQSSAQDKHLLYCPVRGPLNAQSLAKDGLTPTEEARRIDFLKYLLARRYPKEHISVETVLLVGLGERGRNSLRADVTVYDGNAAALHALPLDDRLKHILLVAEIKRDSSKKAAGLKYQLEPALKLLPVVGALGVYWDDINRILFTKAVVSTDGVQRIEIRRDTIANLPAFGRAYRAKSITADTLAPPENLVGVLSRIADIMRSHGVNDEHMRYKETVKLILARYCDERLARDSQDKELALQVFRGGDPDFSSRVERIYKIASKRYSLASSLFKPVDVSELDEDTLKDIITLIQGTDFSSASNETMQQVFMSFVPIVFKKSLDQYFTPLSLIQTAVEMTNIGPTDKVADPAMGTADFLSTAMEYRAQKGDTDIIHRVFGIDSDPKAFELAVINMILNRDGQANLRRADSIANPGMWEAEMDVVLCNPPFGAKTIENRPDVLKHYDLAHEWEQTPGSSHWVKSSSLQTEQQLGILFIERCYKMLNDGGRLAIILPEGYLCTNLYGYVRQWLLDHLQILSVIELPRRMFLRSNADLRSNLLIARKLAPNMLETEKHNDYPIHADLVRKIGYKLGKGFRPIPLRDSYTGAELRSEDNRLLLDSDFTRVKETFHSFTRTPSTAWAGARFSNISNHPALDMKPRRLMPRALANLQQIQAGTFKPLKEIASVLDTTQDTLCEGPSKLWHLIEGQDIRASEGVVIPQEPTRAWVIAESKAKQVYRLNTGDIVVGLVRPERRNIGILFTHLVSVVGAPGGIAVVRATNEEEYPTGWLFAALRSERLRLQFWTESGGTSYGKLTLDNIKNVLVPIPDLQARRDIAGRVDLWAQSIQQGLVTWMTIGAPEDRRIIRNSPTIGLVDTEDWDGVGDLQDVDDEEE